MPDNEMERLLKNCIQSSSQLSLQVRYSLQLAKPPIFNYDEQWTKWDTLSTYTTSLFQSCNIFCLVQHLFSEINRDLNYAGIRLCKRQVGSLEKWGILDNVKVGLS